MHMDKKWEKCNKERYEKKKRRGSSMTKLS